MKYKIIKDRDFLKKKSSPVSTIEEGMEIANQLIEVLNDVKHGCGLSAVQIGILKNVSVVKVRPDQQPWVLINPTIVSSSLEKVVYFEGCLSLLGKTSAVSRHTSVTVSTLNHANPLVFGPDVTPVTNESIQSDYGMFESACVQHEIDHLNGKLITDSDRRVDMSAKKPIKYGRNDKVLVKKNGDTQYIKYKKAEELFSQGWSLV